MLERNGSPGLAAITARLEALKEELDRHMVGRRFDDDKVH
jgi:hypothetical protein